MAWREQVQGDRTLAQCLWHAMDIAALNPSYELQRGTVVPKGESSAAIPIIDPTERPGEDQYCGASPGRPSGVPTGAGITSSPTGELTGGSDIASLALDDIGTDGVDRWAPLFGPLRACGTAQPVKRIAMQPRVGASRTGARNQCRTVALPGMRPRLR